MKFDHVRILKTSHEKLSVGLEMRRRGRFFRQELFRGRNRCLKLQKYTFATKLERCMQNKTTSKYSNKHKVLTFISTTVRHVNLEDF